ncbi:MAG: hypothetical protein HY201_00510 [Nitrospirae bacterium]|nr:hypothetical protein [Candidatus Troglogloeales bacterium]
MTTDPGDLVLDPTCGIKFGSNWQVSTRKIAVKVINHYGDEALKVFET